MPPSGFSKNTVQGLLTFVKGNYEDLQQEVRDGKHPTLEAAIEHEIELLDKALSKLHINNQGELVEH